VGIFSYVDRFSSRASHIHPYYSNFQTLEKMKTVYIASPYTKGDVAVNVKRQIDVASELIDKGLFPYWPEHAHFLHMVHPKSYETWMAQCLNFIPKCDCLLRLAGESEGADREVQFAKERGIPVFYSITEVLEFVQWEEYRDMNMTNGISTDEDLPF